MAPRNVALVGAICVTIGWLLASTLTPPVARVQSRPQERVSSREPAAEPQFTEHLQLRLHEVRGKPENRRNPFVFASPARRVAEPLATPDMEPTVSREVEPRVNAPALVLSGIGISGDTRTAVLSVGNTVQIVRVNDLVSGYTVTEISDTSVTLTRDAERHILRFRQP
jgi:Tfp pilus assembly protein PilP